MLRMACVVCLLVVVGCTSSSADQTADGGAGDDGASADDASGASSGDASSDTRGCKPKCHGKTCGDDGCGGSCGSCRAGEVCKKTLGQCAPSCTPDCGGKCCGDDGCGGSCGTCGAGYVCTGGSSGGGCTPCGGEFTDCLNVPCCNSAPYHWWSATDCTCRSQCIPGGDPYAALCAQNSDCCSDSTCSLFQGQSVGACVGGCDGNACTSSYASGCCPSQPYCWGASGCHSDRGRSGSPCADTVACEIGLTCVAGVCTAPCVPNCSGKSCGDDGCGGSCGSCDGGVCVSGSCCAPACSGKNCGDDGCGGSCGTCASGQICLVGRCQACTPSCTGKQCGDDGCGGSCGTCSVGSCVGGQCVCTPNCAGKNCGDDGCGGSCGSCSVGTVCELGLCTSPTNCDGEACYGGQAAGGCCTTAQFCVEGSGQSNTFCRTTCGASGEGCRGGTDCCSPLACFANVCQ